MRIFETELLQVRHLTRDDSDNLFAVTSDAELVRHLGDGQLLSCELSDSYSRKC